LRRGLEALSNRSGTLEVDFLVVRGSAIAAIEVKVAPTVTDHGIRHLHWFAEH
jgi:predicted AAA+ superfamily ATPase